MKDAPGSKNNQGTLRQSVLLSSAKHRGSRRRNSTQPEPGVSGSLFREHSSFSKGGLTLSMRGIRRNVGQEWVVGRVAILVSWPSERRTAAWDTAQRFAVEGSFRRCANPVR